MSTSSKSNKQRHVIARSQTIVSAMK
uniref:Uncharacterized protein n=1 Tax=Arundo donax TaxID=35708 RepID=A0A0A9A0L2_ARUDO